MNMKIMQFEDITQDQWEGFMKVYYDTMGEENIKNLTFAEKMNLVEQLEKLVKEKGVSDINKFKFEWDTELINFTHKTSGYNEPLVVSTEYRSKHCYTFYLSQN